MTRFDETPVQPAKDYAEKYVREVTARYIGPRRKGLTISGPGDAASFMRGLLRDEVKEHFLALYLNGAHQVVSFSLVSLGDATSAPVHAREVFQGALLVGACGSSSGITTRLAMFSRAPRIRISPGDSSKRGSCFESRFLTTYSFQRPTTFHFTNAESWGEGARAPALTPGGERLTGRWLRPVPLLGRRLSLVGLRGQAATGLLLSLRPLRCSRRTQPPPLPDARPLPPRGGCAAS